MKKFGAIFLLLFISRVALSQNGVLLHHPESVDGQEFADGSIPITI